MNLAKEELDIELNIATMDDYEEVISFYKYVASNTKGMETYGRWIYGLHPTDEMIKNYIDGGYMMIARMPVESPSSPAATTSAATAPATTSRAATAPAPIAAAVALTPFQGEDYHPVHWGIEAADNEVMVVHLLAVNPDFQGQGIARKLMSAVSLASIVPSTLKAIRLDALSCNTPAHKLYESLGFVKRGVQNWYADNTGWIDFFLYEFVV